MGIVPSVRNEVSIQRNEEFSKWFSATHNNPKLKVSTKIGQVSKKSTAVTPDAIKSLQR